MTLLNCLRLSIIFLTLAACKKRDVASETETPLSQIRDSVSYTVNGKSFVSNKIERGTTLTTQSNTKITSGVNFNYLIQGDTDSLLFMRDYAIYADQCFMVLSFVKVYNKADTEFTNENNGGSLFYPKSKTDIFTPGMYKYSTDLWRNNSISGIAIRMINDRGEFKSYGQSDLNKPVSVSQLDQRDAKFEIISIRKRESDYLLEARFNFTVFDENKQSLRIDNGYLRFSVLKIQ